MHFLQKLTDLAPNDPNIFEDLSRRFLGTLMKYTSPKGECVPLKYEGKDGHNVVFIDEHGNIIRLPYKDDHQIEALLPKIGYYNMGGNPIFLVKNPQRQWKRSLCNGVYKMVGITSEIGRPGQGQWFEIAKETIKPQYVSLDDLTHPLFINIALNRNLCIAKISLPAVPSKAGLFYKRYLIGYLDYDKHTVKVLQPTLRQEIEDYFKHQRILKWNLN